MTKSTYFMQECPTCGRRLQVRVVYLGKTVVCQHCRGAFEASDPAMQAPAPCQSGLALLQRADELLAEAAHRIQPAS